MKRADLFVDEDRVKDAVEQIKKMAENRGFRNTLNVDRQIFIESYAEKFAEFYTKVFHKHRKSLHKIMLDHFYECFEAVDIPEIAESAIKKLKNNVAKFLLECVDKAVESIERVEAYNMPPLVMTPNEHYYNELFTQMLAEESVSTSVATDDGSAKLIYYQIQAYIKVQKKVVIECGAKELMLHLFVKSEEKFKTLLKTNLSSLVELIKEPKKVEQERIQLRKRKEVFERALAEMNSI